MNIILKIALSLWLLLCILVVWVGCAVVGLLFAFSEYGFMYGVTPFIGLTAAVPMFYLIYRIVIKPKSQG